MVKFRFREEELREKWLGKERQSVNGTQFLFVTREKEEEFYHNMYPTKQDRENFNIYRNEWYKRSAKFEHGNFPLAVTIEL